MAETIKFSPAIPFPVPFDVQKRIKELHSFLDPGNPFYDERQNVNIKAVIKLYEDGKINGEGHVHIMDGEVVPKEKIFKGPSCSWTEGICHQYAQKHAYSHGPFGRNYHEIRMLLRLTPELGGDGTEYGIIAMNDTGSDILSLFTTDIPNLGNNAGYLGWHGPVAIIDANGSITLFQRILVQVQLVRDDNTPWSDWIDETAIVRQPSPNVIRLSGAEIREVLYFGTAPGNHLLAVSSTKGGLTSLL